MQNAHLSVKNFFLFFFCKINMDLLYWDRLHLTFQHRHLTHSSSSHLWSFFGLPVHVSSTSSFTLSCPFSYLKSTCESQNLKPAFGRLICFASHSFLHHPFFLEMTQFHSPFWLKKPPLYLPRCGVSTPTHVFFIHSSHERQLAHFVTWLWWTTP